MSTGQKILIVDDSDIERRMLCAVLKKKGFDPAELRDGTRIMETLESERPDAVLLDIMMPGIHGKDVLALIRKKHSAIELPVLMTTAKSEAEDVIECLTLGANDFLPKPIEFGIAVSRLQTHLKIAELSRELSRLKQGEAVAAMIATYNHEINNPVAIALGALRGLPQVKDEPNYAKLEKALWRVADIVKKIRDLSQESDIQYSAYSSSAKIVKLK